VRESAQRLHGTVDVVSAPGRRTTFALGLPLTVSTTGCLLVEEGGQILALPVTNVLRIVRLEPGDIRQAEGSEAVRVGGEPLPLVRLAHLVGSPPSAPDEGRMPAVILGSAERRGACLVRGLVGVRDLVVTGLPAPLPRVPNAAGAAVLGTGEVVVVLDAADLMRGSAPREAVSPNGGAPPRAEERIVLIADDSITTRTLERNILRGAGYRVRVAADGIEAWGLLQSDGADLVVTDVRMPRMDGLELTRKIRSEERFKRLPVVLVTSLESPTDRERGVEAGADAYVVKSTFDQERLLEIVRRLI
jgi:two-component system chemotaxis sensor kinase CheA